MKEISDKFIAREEAKKQKPVELFHIWREGGEDWYYTSGDVSIEFDGKLYIPATISRELVQYDSQLQVTKTNVYVGYVENPVLEFISINPIEILWVSIMRLHRDQDPLEADVVLLGQIKNVSFKGIQAIVECVGFEKFLEMPVPRFRYQLNCNHQIYDSKCQVSKSYPPEGYKVTATVTLDTTKTQLTSDAFGGEFDDGYFTGGTVEFGIEKRTIIAHSGNVITIAFMMKYLESNDEVDVYPGCDGRAETCREKFDNLLHFFGFPFTPDENPAVRIP